MIVYVDGENVVHQIMDALKRAGRTELREEMLNVDLAGLIRQLVRKSDITIKYYTTTLQIFKNDAEIEQRSRDMIAWTARWVNHLTDEGIEVIKAGKLMAREGVACPNCGFKQTVFREKGVDVRLAVDLTVDSETEKLLVVWSSDADLLPAVQVAKERGCRVKNLANADALNWALARQAGEWQTYTDEELMKLVGETIVPETGVEAAAKPPAKRGRRSKAAAEPAPDPADDILNLLQSEKHDHGDQP